MSVTGILGKKVGMTQIFDDRGEVHPVTVLKAGPCVITQIKTLAKDGYEAAQIGYVDFVKASKVNKAMTGHFAKSIVPPVRVLKEVALEASVEPKEGEEANGAENAKRRRVTAKLTKSTKELVLSRTPRLDLPAVQAGT